MGDAIRAAVAALALATLLSGCTFARETSSRSANRPQPGVLRVVGLGTIDSLLPELSGNNSSADIAMLWGAWLYLVDDKGHVVPELATDVPSTANRGISADGLRLTYHLRRGVRWQDGAPFDARDVIFTWHLIMDRRNNIVSRLGYDRIASMQAPTPYTVVVRLARPYAPAILTFFAPSVVPMCVLPAHLLQRLPDINRAAYDLKPVGTGPFMLERYDPQSRVVLRPNPHYWRGRPKLREIDFILVPYPTTRALMMRSGDADFYYFAATTAVPYLRDVPKLRVIDRTFSEFWYLVFNVRSGPLSDVRVRRAVAMGVDRQRVIKVVALGLGTIANGDQPPYSPYSNPNVRGPRYDPAAARAALEAVGWRLGTDGFRYKDGKRLRLTYVTSSGYGEGHAFASLFQSSMRVLGIDVTIKLYPTSILFASQGGILDSRRFDVALSGWLGGLDPDDATLWMCDQAPPTGFNFGGYCDPRVDAQERIALRSYDTAVRRGAYWRVQELVDQDAPVEFLWFGHVVDYVRPEFRGFRPAPVVSQFWNSWEWQI